jgi:hypothetical protein
MCYGYNMLFQGSHKHTINGLLWYRNGNRSSFKVPFLADNFTRDHPKLLHTSTKDPHNRRGNSGSISTLIVLGIFWSVNVDNKDALTTEILLDLISLESRLKYNLTELFFW